MFHADLTLCTSDIYTISHITSHSQDKLSKHKHNKHHIVFTYTTGSKNSCFYTVNNI